MEKAAAWAESARRRYWGIAFRGVGAVAGVAGVDPSQKATLLAAGISEAMNCTAFGLGVGIISLLGFSVLNGRTQALLDDIDEVSAQVMNLISGSRQAAPPQV